MKKVIVTTSWDDGHKLDIKLASLLKKYGINGTFYVSPQDKEYKKEKLLSDQEIKQLSQKFEIGAHTMTHPHLTKISLKKANKEILDSKKYLERITGKKVFSFCYPYGEYNNEIKTLVKKAGFTVARSVIRFSFSNSEPFALKTSIHTYNHITDLHKIVKFSKGNPIKFIMYLNWENMAKAMFDEVYEKGGVFHIWGHSWEIEKLNEWDKLERVFQYIANRINVSYRTNKEILI
jgi:peptidoglycan-N-acetylglucosamine deacetylase